jgi:hypothetical protein
MEKIIEPRKSGKTTLLINKSAASGDYIVCEDNKNAIIIKRRALDMGLNIPCPITYEEFINKRYFGKNIKGFLIDNADYFLQYLSHIPIHAITMSLYNENT